MGLGEWDPAYLNGFMAGSIATAVVAALVFLTARTGRDVYGLQHWKLNVRIPFSSLWMNLGYWTAADGSPIQHFDDACSALLREVLWEADVLRRVDAYGSLADVAGGQSGRRGPISILDLGIGCGDQTCEIARLMAKERRDVSYLGLTLNEGQAECAALAVERLKEKPGEVDGDQALGTSFQVFCGDAAKPDSWTGPVKAAADDLRDLQDARTGLRAEGWVLALDCLYHFSPSRREIFRHAARNMGASFMAFDLLLNEGASPTDKLLARLLGTLMGCPWRAFLTEAEYVDQLVGAGYARGGVAVRDVTGQVFPGLLAYLARRRRELARFGVGFAAFDVARRGFAWFYGTGVLRAAIVVARKETTGG